MFNLFLERKGEIDKEAIIMEEREILIVGGGICGLATALALHRKGLKSVVLEKSDTLRTTGSAITIFPNGWRALRQLGVDSTLRSTAVSIERVISVFADKGVDRMERESPMSEGEVRCIRRSDLVETLANALPLETIQFGVQVVTVNVEKSSSYTLVQLHDGSLIKAKVLIGCDGANSLIGNYIGVKPTCLFSSYSVRGVTTYPDGHGYATNFLMARKDGHLLERIPIDRNTVYWFFTLRCSQTDSKKPKDPTSIKQMILDKTYGFSKDIVEMLEKSDLSSLSLTKLRSRAPWNLLFGNFRRETIIVAGDAWHVMGPFLGQGGSVALEDAIVLARCLSKKICNGDLSGAEMHFSTHKAIEALDEFLKERRRRVVLISTLSYLTGILLVEEPSFLLRTLCIIIIYILFQNPLKQSRYDCGEL